ncbi:hypothetical protein [Pseudomonas sp. Marseille-Q8238]
MALKTDDFTLHDVDDFPLVRFRGEAAIPGYAPVWADELEALLAHGERFVILYGAMRQDESHEDRKSRGLWLKRRKAELGRYCAGLVSVVADAQAREAMQPKLDGAVRAFGVAQVLAADAEEAERLALGLLAESRV